MRRLWSAATKATVTLFPPDANKKSRIPKKIVGIPHGFSFAGRRRPISFLRQGEGLRRPVRAAFASSPAGAGRNPPEPAQTRVRPASVRPLPKGASCFGKRGLFAVRSRVSEASGEGGFRAFCPSEVARGRAGRLCTERIFSAAANAAHAILSRRGTEKKFFPSLRHAEVLLICLPVLTERSKFRILKQRSVTL